MTEPARLSLSNINKAFAAPVLKGINLSVAPGEIHAIVGENGAGKSTLVNILAGNVHKDSGQLFLDGKNYDPKGPRDSYRSGIACAAQELSSIDTLSVAENIALRELPGSGFVIDQQAINASALKLMQRVGLTGVDPAAAAETLSLAERQLLEIAKVLAVDCRLILLDEPTAALTAPQADQLHRVIRDLAATGASIIYISHRLDDVLEISNNVSVMRDGRLVSTAAPSETSGPQLVEEMTGRNQAKAIKRRDSSENATVALKAIDMTTDDLPHAIDMSCNTGEIVGLAGLAGAGRSEMLSALFGLVPLRSGSVRRVDGRNEVELRSAGHSVKNGIAYLGEDRQTMGLFPGQSLLVNMMVPGTVNVAPLQSVKTAEEKDAGDSLVDKLAIRCNSITQDIRELSGGNQQKALIARWLHRDSDVLLLDEPTRGVDVGTKNAIYDLLLSLRQKGKTIIMASSEIDELTTVCDRILVLSNRKLVKSFERASFSEQDILTAAFSEFAASMVTDPENGRTAERTFL